MSELSVNERLAKIETLLDVAAKNFIEQRTNIDRQRESDRAADRSAIIEFKREIKEAIEQFKNDQERYDRALSERIAKLESSNEAYSAIINKGKGVYWLAAILAGLLFTLGAFLSKLIFGSH